MNIIKKKFIVLTSFIALTGCSSLVPVGNEVALKYFGVVKGAADVATYSATGKTVNDHFLSAVIGKDCSIGRIVTRRPICIEIDKRSHKYSIFNKGKIISKNNVVDMKFPSEIYDFSKTLEKDLKKKLKKSNLKITR